MSAPGQAGEGATDLETRPGIFARVFPRPSAGEVAAAVADAGYGCVQLNLSSFGQPTLAAPIEKGVGEVDLRAVKSDFDAHGVAIWGLSATYNMIHPDEARRRSETAQACTLIEASAILGIDAVTVCTGTLDPDDMWRGHRDNGSSSAWTTMRASLDELLGAAARADVVIGIEPELSNVVSNATRARRLLDELGPDARHLAIVLDPANLFSPSNRHDQARLVHDAFTMLGNEIICIQAKDLDRDGFAHAGEGALDLDLTYHLRASLGRPVPVIIQDTPESDAPAAGELLTGIARTHPMSADPAVR